MAQKEWDILEVRGDKESTEILFAKLEKFLIGSLDVKEGIDIYIKPDSETEVNYILNNFDSSDLSFKWKVLENKDWHLMWQKHFRSIIVKQQIQILPDWDKDSNINKFQPIFIRPGMSFGTGHHETTYLMLESLLDYKDRDFSLLDLGSGSGILGIAGNKLGYSKISSVEYDEVCKNDFEYNLKINKCSKINMHWMDATLWTDFNYDLVLANIEKNILKNILKNIGKGKAIFVLSGLLIEDKGEMRGFLHDNSFSIKQIRQRNEWIAITCVKDEE